MNYGLDKVLTCTSSAMSYCPKIDFFSNARSKTRIYNKNTNPRGCPALRDIESPPNFCCLLLLGETGGREERRLRAIGEYKQRGRGEDFTRPRPT